MLTRNYDTYSFTQFNMVPELDVLLIETDEEVPHGGGEPAVVTMGGAVANAVFDATGARIFREPLTPELRFHDSARHLAQPRRRLGVRRAGN